MFYTVKWKVIYEMMEKKVAEKLGVKKVFWFQAPKDDLEKVAREASARFEAYIKMINGANAQ